MRQASRDYALRARLIEQATRVADFIKASGVTPRSQAGHMTAPSKMAQSSEKALAWAAVHICRGTLFTDVTPAARRVMQSNKASNTKPEIAVRKIVHGMGYRYRLHRRDLPGKPDIVLSFRRKIVLVHGYFWHGHACPSGSKTELTRSGYWSTKIAGNKRRDARVEDELRSAGWGLCVVWECGTRDAQALALRLKAFLEGKVGPCCPD